MTCKSFAMVCRALILSMLMFSLQSATAGMIGTDQVAGVGSAQTERSHISSLLARADVTRQLHSFGVDVKTAQDRVAMLTDEEARSLAGNLQNVPAGADSGWWIAAAIIVVVLAWWYWGRR
jgi:hypothetical protein